MSANGPISLASRSERASAKNTDFAGFFRWRGVRAPPLFNSNVDSSDSSGRARPAGSDSGRPAIDWAEARDYYLALPPQERSHQAVADRFGVRKKTVENHAFRERWRDQLAAIEAETAALVAAELARARARRQIVREGLIDRSYARYGEQLDEGAEVRPSDFVQIAKLDMASGPPAPTDEPQNRTEIVREVVSEVRDVLIRHPDALEALREHFRENTDGR
jgi:hypothetical protein